ncbi:23S rRNA (pseudouridine(1915)-N(3))-methyltransferase RlmH [Maritalea mediterranea]|uniref:Ribosomal RNA large subunit methyltransferase H n=1 Tax=Maritalea mediterranea TaxID=2909667 RepID=A0ABS9E3U3_9HYPH|nr:23S rRNA (pseudouridine(1915)-N(3))-methyltransferase RlmH [Maritalea mediterranea]MCF4097535.1 23S rRNA (pseudouridine(1915)-N(3))-methyltransferase RlmH [Maritalea mediterranea]
MKLHILAVGRLKDGPERHLVDRYVDRAKASGRQLGFGDVTVRELPESRAKQSDQRKKGEADAIRQAMADGAILVLLDERGKSLDSEKFAQRIGSWRDQGTRDCYFVIGGADGLDKVLLQQADLTLNFSTLTWPHQIVRVMLAEQIYRATTILSGHPYHRS